MAGPGRQADRSLCTHRSRSAGRGGTCHRPATDRAGGANHDQCAERGGWGRLRIAVLPHAQGKKHFSGFVFTLKKLIHLRQHSMVCDSTKESISLKESAVIQSDEIHPKV